MGCFLVVDGVINGVGSCTSGFTPQMACVAPLPQLVTADMRRAAFIGRTDPEDLDYPVSHSFLSSSHHLMRSTGIMGNQNYR